jgi:holo-ACP synthase
MSCAALRNSLLAARDRRQALLDGLFPLPLPAALMLSLNLPGERKTGERAERLFAWGERALVAALPTLQLLERDRDALGPFALFLAPLAAEAAKRLAIAVEQGEPAGRLLDIDVFDAAGRPVDRASLGLPPRSCLICPEPALACIRAGRHTSSSLQQQVQSVIDALFSA